MNNYIIFEDSAHMPVSQLLQRELGDSVIFTDGAENLSYYLDMHINDNVICYIDYASDNLNTVDNYNTLLEDYGDYTNIKIVKIPCIELLVYLLLNYFNVIREFCVADNNIIEYIISNTDNYNGTYEQSSLEKYIKAVTEVRPRCVNTKNKRNDSFYKVSCKCSFMYCNAVSINIPIERKAEILLSYLPFKFNGSGDIMESSMLDYAEILYRANIVACINNIAKNRRD